MNKTILLLGDESTYMVGFQDALMKASYGFDRLSSVEDLYSRVDSQEIKMILFCYNESKETQDIINTFVQKYPQFPIVYVLPHDTDFERSHKFNIFRKIVRPLSKKKDFIKLIEDMHLLSNSLSIHSKNQTVPFQFFDNLDLNAVIDKIFRHFSKTVKCKNIHWLLKEEFNRIVGAFHSNEELDPLASFNRSVLLQSLDEIEYMEAVELVERMAVPANYFGKPFVLEMHENEYKNYLLPIYNQKNKDVLAYLLFEGIEVENGAFIVEQIKETLGIMSKHIGFSIDFWNAQGLSFMDDLTELYNQKYLEMVVQNEISRSQRQRKKFTVLFIDIDHFKKVNDNNGHWVGSKILIDLGKKLKGLLRSSDYAFRYGGDEFVVVLPETSAENGKIVAERIRKYVENTTFKIDEVELQITVSIGLAAYPDHASTHKEIIQMADEAMYCGKNLSRNVVYNAS